MSVCFSVCLSVHHVWKEGGGVAAEGDGEGGQEGRGQWGGVIHVWMGGGGGVGFRRGGWTGRSGQ